MFEADRQRSRNVQRPYSRFELDPVIDTGTGAIDWLV